MPVASIPLLDVDQTITRPAVLDVVRQIREITGISQDIPVVYVGQGESRHQPGSVVGKDESTVQMGSQEMVSIEVDESYAEEFFATNPGHRVEQHPDFIDNRLQVSVRPIYAVCNFDVNFIYRTPSRAEAIRWRNDAQFNASQMRDVNMHSLTYYYMVPNPCMNLLEHIHTLREKQAPYGDTFEEYVREHITTRSTDAVDITGEKLRLTIRETQMRVQGFFDFQAQPQKQEKNTEKAVWEVQFTYRFSFSKPVAVSMRYPVIVHNQLIDDKYLPQTPVDPEHYDARMALSTNAFHYFEAHRVQERLVGEKTLKFYPEFDQWEPKPLPPDTLPYLSVLLEISKDAPNLLANLNDLGDYIIDPDVLAFIAAGEYRYVNKLFSSMIQVSLYRNQQLVRHDRFSVNANLDVTLLEPADLRCNYRLVISFCSQIQMIDYRAIRRVVPYPAALQKLIRLARSNRGQIRSLLPYLDIEHLFLDLPNTGYSRQEIIDNIVSMKTVMNAYAEASRIDPPTSILSAKFEEPKLGAPETIQP